MYDAAIYYRRGPGRTRSTVSACIRSQYVLATIHRAENTDAPDGCTAIFAGLNALADEMPVVVPLHPRTRWQP